MPTNNIIALSERRAAIPYEKRTLTASETFALEVITLDTVDEETTRFIMQCLGYPATAIDQP